MKISASLSLHDVDSSSQQASSDGHERWRDSTPKSTLCVLRVSSCSTSTFPNHKEGKKTSVTFSLNNWSSEWRKERLKRWRKKSQLRVSLVLCCLFFHYFLSSSHSLPIQLKSKTMHWISKRRTQHSNPLEAYFISRFDRHHLNLNGKPSSWDFK